MTTFSCFRPAGCDLVMAGPNTIASPFVFRATTYPTRTQRKNRDGAASSKATAIVLMHEDHIGRPLVTLFVSDGFNK